MYDCWVGRKGIQDKDNLINSIQKLLLACHWEVHQLTFNLPLPAQPGTLCTLCGSISIPTWPLNPQIKITHLHHPEGKRQYNVLIKTENVGNAQVGKISVVRETNNISGWRPFVSMKDLRRNVGYLSYHRCYLWALPELSLFISHF